MGTVTEESLEIREHPALISNGKLASEDLSKGSVMKNVWKKRPIKSFFASVPKMVCERGERVLIND